MNKRLVLLYLSLLFILLLAACAPQKTTEKQGTDRTNESQKEEKGDTESHSSSKDKENSSSKKDQVLMLIDQTQEEPPNSFFFAIKKLPEGYELEKMSWESGETVTNTREEAINNGKTGSYGFYISGNGQFMGFTYDPSWKGRKGQAVFYFNNYEDNQKEQLTWRKTITLR